MRVLAWPAFRNREELPYNWLLYSHLQQLGVRVDETHLRRSHALAAGRYAIWHMHWPEAFLNLGRRNRAVVQAVTILALAAASRAMGTRLIWTSHNLAAHERLFPRLEAIYKQRLFRYLHGVIACSPTGAQLVRDSFPELRARPSCVVPLGHFLDVYPNTVPRAAARGQLGLEDDQRVLLFLGAVRPYKNVPTLIEQFKRMPDPQLRLVVAGKPQSAEYAATIRRAAENDARIRLELRFVPNADLQIFYNASDLVVLPYQEILNSASAIAALSFYKPVVVPRKGALEDLRTSLELQAISTYCGELSSDVLQAALEATHNDIETPAVIDHRLRNRIGWPQIARQTLDFYQQLAS